LATLIVLKQILECTTCGDYSEFFSVQFNITCQMEAGDFLSEYTVRRITQRSL